MNTVRKIKNNNFHFALSRLVVITLFMVALFLIVLFVLPERSAAAGNSTGGTYTITSVQIKEGDSLWSLASQYYTEEYSSLTEYITEIKRMNGLSSDVLFAGNYILLPHFITE